MDLGNSEARKVQYQFGLVSSLAFKAQYLRMLRHYAKTKKVTAIVAAMGLLLSALKKPYSQNSSAQVTNSGSTNAGISKASGILYGTGRFVLRVGGQSFFC
jgi:hypothetical protein